jgi:hypothetical protein
MNVDTLAMDRTRGRFAELAHHEPRLWGLYLEVLALNEIAKSDPAFDAERQWFGGQGACIKRKLMRLVGTTRLFDKPAVASSEAYEAAYTFLYAAMPDQNKP